MEDIHILVCDDHEILRKGIVQLLKLQPGFEIVGEAANGLEAVELAESLHPDIILMDVIMPKLNGIEATARIRAKNSDIKIIMLTISDQDDDLFNAIRCGANGYLLKNVNLQEMFTYLKLTYEGNLLFPTGLADKILQQFSNIPSISKGREMKGLSEREQEVIELVSQGKSNKNIAEDLFITENTVKKHLRNILEKLHANNRAEAVSLALQKGLIRREN